MAEVWYLKPASAVALGRGSDYLFLVRHREPVALRDVDVDALAGVVARAVTPVSEAELLELCGAEAIDTLVELGVLERGTRDELEQQVPRRHVATSRRCKRLVCAITGAVGAVTAIDHIAMLADVFAEEVDVVISGGAQHFVQPRVFEYYGFRTWSDPHQPMHGFSVPHEHLAQAADLVLVAPACASTIARLASGACSDFISLLVSATSAPVVVAPSMNPTMWRHPPIARNVAQLRADGVWVIDPGMSFLVAQRSEGGVGGVGYDHVGLVRALDAILGEHASAGQ